MALENSELSAEDLYRQRTQTSEALSRRAREVFPSGITHDSRFMQPHPISIDRADRSRKWDVDGNEYVDYFGGHGALILGHNHPEVTGEVREQLSRGTHYGASHELELEWAEQVRSLIPCAEKVRFTGSGTEATMLAFRVARAFAGKPKILRFVTHFHGWHDQAAFHSHESLPAGIPPELAENIVLCEPNDLEQVRQKLEAQQDIAAVILEPTGASFGRVPTSGAFLKGLRELSEQYGVLLIFDEVISGFRCSPGGAQAYYGVTPDLTSLAKILAGGFPGGALVGRADVMDGMSMRDDPGWNAGGRVAHQGTFNANPISARAGLTTLKLIAEGNITEQANQKGAALREAMNEVARNKGSGWVVYGEFSSFHIFANTEDIDISLEAIYAGKVPHTTLKQPMSLVHQTRMAFLAEGIDLISWPGGLVSAFHSEEDLAQTAKAYGRVLERFNA